MAGLSGITIKTSEYRPCFVDGKNALFHRWSQVVDVEYSNTFAIVEFEDGRVEEVKPDRVKFLDQKFKDYCFE